MSALVDHHPVAVHCIAVAMALCGGGFLVGLSVVRAAVEAWHFWHEDHHEVQR